MDEADPYKAPAVLHGSTVLPRSCLGFPVCATLMVYYDDPYTHIAAFFCD